MPLLAPEPNFFPEGLFRDAELPQGSGRRWYVMYTRSRQEKSLARELYQRGIPFYLPLIARRHRFRRRWLMSYVPLFPCYLPVYADWGEWTTACRTTRIVRPLEVPDQEVFWRELRQTEQLVASGLPITPEGRLTLGARVTVRSGPLAGLQGVILRGATGSRFVVQVNFIQRGASVLIDYLDLAVCH